MSISGVNNKGVSFYDWSTANKSKATSHVDVGRIEKVDTGGEVPAGVKQALLNEPVIPKAVPFDDLLAVMRAVNGQTSTGADPSEKH